MVYDIIGDVHGQWAALRKLLLRLGYRPRNSGFVPPAGRRAVFVGDIVDRGPEVRRSLRCVRWMVDEGHADMVLGNHEFFLVRYLSRDAQGAFRLAHTPMRFSVVESTLQDFAGLSEELYEYIDWIRSQPLWWEWPDFRVVHACWNDADIAFMRRCHPENCLSESLLDAFAQRNAQTYFVVDRMLSGLRVYVPRDMIAQPTRRVRPDHLRVKWWLSFEEHPMSDFDTQDLDLPDKPFPKEVIPGDYHYPCEAPPLFLGHYCFKPPIQRQLPNLAVVDYCVVSTGRLCAYRFEGESTLLPEHFISG
jgi:hypothetical protein